MWYFVRAIGSIFPIALLFSISSEKLAAYILIAQYFVVFAQISSSALSSSFLDQNNNADIRLFLSNNTRPSILAFVACLISTLYLSLNHPDKWPIFFLISIFFIIKLFYQVALKKYISETKVIFFGEVIYSLLILINLILINDIYTAILIALMLNVLVLIYSTYNLPREEHSVVNNEGISKNIKRLWSFAILSVYYSLNVYIIMSLVNPGMIIAIKFALLVCTPITFLQSSIKSQFLLKPEITFVETFKYNKNRILISLSLVVISIVAFYYLPFFEIRDLSDKLNANEFLIISLSILIGSLFLLVVTFRVGYSVWIMHTGSYSLKLATCFMMYFIVPIIFLDINSSALSVSLVFLGVFLFSGTTISFFAKILEK